MTGERRARLPVNDTMPIYEFYCEACHTLFSFLARRPGVRRRPDCPRCGRARLERRASAFAVSRGRPDDAGDAPGDHGELESALDRLAADVEHVDENDPRQIGGLMRRLFDTTGLPMGDTMREAVARMESGEDPETIETELGDALEQEQTSLGPADGAGGLRALRRRVLPARVDRTLYDL